MQSPNHRGSGMAAIPKIPVFTFLKHMLWSCRFSIEIWRETERQYITLIDAVMYYGHKIFAGQQLMTFNGA